MRRLTGSQIAHTIGDVLGVEAKVDELADDQAAGFAANIQPVDGYQLETLVRVAEETAAAALSKNRSQWFTCDIAETACVEPWIESIGRRLFRRPLDAETRTGLMALYEESRLAWGADEAILRVLEAMLVSPHFLYLVEDEPTAEVAAIDDFELASRVSYFLWNSPPDETLLAAAAAGELSHPAGLEAQVRRMLDDEDAVARTVRSFYAQWLALDDPRVDEKDADRFPYYTPEVARSMRGEVLAFAEEVYREGGTLETLLTAPYTFVDARLAALYEVEPPASGFGRVELDPTKRAGILTMPRFLAAHAHYDKPSWVARGLFVRESLLCETLPDPPPDAPMDTANDPDRTRDPNCATCHQRLDPVGQGFDHYDATGIFRATDVDGEPIDADGRIVDAGLETEDFDNVVTLAASLSRSDAVRSCVARHWLRYAVAYIESAADACAVRAIEERFEASGYDLRELLVAVVMSDAFRYRRISEPEAP